MMGYFTVLAIPVLLIACSSRESHTLGRSFEERTPATVAEAQRSAVESTIVLQGTITEKCPIAGCWFVLQDQAGKIKVDTKNAGFVVVGVPLQSTVTVAGRVATNGHERIIDAIGLRY